MTTGVDQRVGRDALARDAVLFAEVATVRAELDAILGAGRHLLR